MPTCLSPLLAKLSTRRRAASDPHDEPAKPVMPVWPQRHEEEEKKGECLGRHGPCAATLTGAWNVEPPSYDALCAHTAALNGPLAPCTTDSAALDLLEKAVEALSPSLRELSLLIHSLKETAYKEHGTHDALCEFFEREEGWQVERRPYGGLLKTSFRATCTVGSGKGPVIGFNSEMDALPGIGHACGHNLIAIAGVAAACSLASVLLKSKSWNGKIVLLGTPAEETDGGKIRLIKAGAYKPMDVCLMLHPGPSEGLLGMLATAGFIVEFEGHNAHAAGAPWEGVNAQDAVVLAYNNISALRQQISPSHRVHGIIQGSEHWVQNIIPATSSASFGVRAPTQAELDVLRPKVENCFRAAALATGCKLKITDHMAYKDLRNSAPLADQYRRYMKHRQDVEMTAAGALGSTDFGDVSYELPALHPIYAIPVGPGEGNHTPGFAACAATMEAHKNTLRAAKGIAAAGYRAATDTQFLEDCKKDFEDSKLWR